MIDECQGPFGTFFGHKFKSFLIKKACNPDGFICNTNSIEEFNNFVKTLTNEYEVRCKRCGKKPEDLDNG